MTQYDVAALGELLIDFTENGISPQGNPLLEANPGGAPCNVLSMLQKLGHRTAFIGKVGNDGFGKMLKKAIGEQGIDPSCLYMDDDVHTTLAIVTKTADGDRDFSFYRDPGADIMLKKDEVDEELIRNAKIFHFGTLSFTDEPAREATMHALETAQRYNRVISFDPNIRPPLWRNMDDAHYYTDYGLSRSQIVKIADNEISWFTGEDDYDKAAAKLLQDYPNIRLLTVSLGREGSMAFLDGKRAEMPAYLQEGESETTGCGDAFMGCVLHCFLENGFDMNETEMRDMLKFANAAASIVSTRKGALRVMPEKEEIEDLLKGRQDEILL